MACGRNSRSYLIVTFSALGGILFGYQTGVISGLLIMKDFQNMTGINDDGSNISDGLGVKVGAIVGILLFGCFLGSLIAGQTSDRFSRKYSISFFSFIFSISVLLQTLRVNLSLVLIARLIAGIAIGALSMIVPVYHSEIAATKLRGRLITFQQLAITIGIALSFWINYITTTDSKIDGTRQQWQIPVGIQMIPSFILTVGILFCPFSPRWLIFQDREDEARDVLKKIRSGSDNEIEEEMTRIKNEVAYLRENEIESYRQLVRRPLLHPFLLGIGIQILQQFTGINSLNYYAPKFFAIIQANGTIIFGIPNDQSNTLQSSALLLTGYYGCLKIIFTIPAIIFVDKIGRRILLIIGSMIMFVSMLCAAILIAVYIKRHCPPKSEFCNYDFPSATKGTADIIIVFLYIFVSGYSFSWGPIPWIYCTEIFPLTMRAKATSLTTATNWAVNCMISFLIPLLFIQIYYGIFLIFSIFCALMIGIIYFCYPETKKMHLEPNEISNSHRKLWLEKRVNYNTITDQVSVSQTHSSTVHPQNS